MVSAPHLPAFSRRVRCLRIRASRADEARCAALALSDALHTASMPDADHGRFIVIRRLAVGRIRAQASAATLALLVERSVREALDRAVEFTPAAAAAADAVVFPSHAEALVELARCLARHDDTTGWLWDHVVPGWRAAPSTAARWRLLLAAAHTLEESAGAAAAIVHEAARLNAVDELLVALRPGEIAHFLQREGWSESVVAAPVAHAPLLGNEAGRVLERARQALDESDLRLVWLGVMLAVHEQPARAADSRLPQRIAAWLRSGTSAEGRQGDRRMVRDATRHELIEPPPAPRRSAAKPEGPTVREVRALLAEPAPPAASPIDEVSACGGLLFLIPIVRRLGLAAYLDRHVALLESAFPAQLFLFIGQHLGLRNDDPLAQALAADLPAGSTGTEIPQGLLVAWFAAVRRRCRRASPRIDLRGLIQRPARVLATRTQIDITFAPSQADIDLRRHGLDIDPGWVPWFGRIVRFHYFDSHDCP